MEAAPRRLERRKLSTHGPEVSVLGLGCWQFSGSGDLNWGQGFSEEASIATIRAAYEAGINFFDTAEAYGDGNAEKILGKALKDVPREQLVIAGKVSPTHLTASQVEAACN